MISTHPRSNTHTHTHMQIFSPSQKPENCGHAWDNIFQHHTTKANAYDLLLSCVGTHSHALSLLLVVPLPLSPVCPSSLPSHSLSPSSPPLPPQNYWKSWPSIGTYFGKQFYENTRARFNSRSRGRALLLVRTLSLPSCVLLPLPLYIFVSRPPLSLTRSLHTPNPPALTPQKYRKSWLSMEQRFSTITLHWGHLLSRYIYRCVCVCARMCATFFNNRIALRSLALQVFL